ncbi:unnamed protein product [Anisakis simplex]|uniref:Sushi domain-containing protein n=1 Tax=Anisakis simplex TaxID=6269 RepID=A0A0M3JYJ6_ANISI|nr:unnamed protein product [Anisakis simplex]
MNDSSLCPMDGYPTNAVAVSIWIKRSTKVDESDIYRIGGMDLLQEGFEADQYPNNAFVVLSAGTPPRFCVCAIQCECNLGVVFYQTNSSVPPPGYKNIDDKEQALYCVNNEGDCGADVPIYMHKHKSSSKLVMNDIPIEAYAYAINKNVTISGYERNAKALCYGWSIDKNKNYIKSADEAESNKSLMKQFKQQKQQTNSGNGCTPVSKILNGRVKLYLISFFFHSIVYQPVSSMKFPLYTVITVQCNDGFMLVGSGMLTCTPMGWYPESLIGGCVERNGGSPTEKNICSAFPAPAHGRIRYSTEGSAMNGIYPTGTIAILQCNAGFYPTFGFDNLESKCVNGVWSISMLDAFIPFEKSLTFQVEYVFNEKTNQNQRISAGQIGMITIGTYAKLTCVSGYEVTGSDTVICTPDGWMPSQTLGTCQLLGINTISVSQCITGMPFVLGGQVSYSQGGIFGPYPFGTIATLNCDPGLGINGKLNSISCKKAKSWSTKRRILAIILSVFLRPRTATCTGQTWNPPSFGTCNIGEVTTSALKTQCIFGLVPPIGGSISYSSASPLGPYPTDTIATLRCSSGLAKGASISRCVNGQWEPNTLGECPTGYVGGSNNGQCVTGAPNVAYGQISYSNNAIFGPFPPGTVGTLKCNPGFRGTIGFGSTTTICSNGDWIPPLAQCELLSSTTISDSCLTGVFPPFNGRVIYSNDRLTGPYPSGTTVTVRCNPGFTASGTTTATCLDGQFTPSLIAQCSQDGDGGLSTAQCVTLFPPLNGQISYMNRRTASLNEFGTVATVTCNLGFTVSGGATRTTCINGQWNPPVLGTCQSGLGGNTISPLGGTTAISRDCLFALPAVLNGNIQYSTGTSIGPFVSSSTATLTCSFGSVPLGPMTSTCANGSWQPPNLGPCSRNGNCWTVSGRNWCISWTDQVSNMYRSGTVVILTCNPGFTISGSRTAVCNNGRWMPWPGIGFCKRSAETLDEVSSSSPSHMFGKSTHFVNDKNVITFCTSQQNPSNGYIHYDNSPTVGSYPMGTIAELRCDDGYTVSGTPLSVCHDSVWNPDLGQCQTKDDIREFSGPGNCMKFPEQPNGKVYYIQAGSENEYELGTTAILICNNEFVVKGQNTLTCTKSGWTPHDGFGFCKLDDSFH